MKRPKESFSRVGAPSLLASEVRQTIRIYAQQAVPGLCPRTGEDIRVLSSVDPQTGFEHRLYFPRLGFSCPAVEFEKATGLSGIAQNYALPQGLPPVEISQYVTVLAHAARQGDISAIQERLLVLRLLDVLKNDNPSLKTLRHEKEDVSILRDIVHGVTSTFCVQDIQHFIDGNYLRVSLANPEYKALYHKVQDLSGGDIFWVPALETLQKIERQSMAKDMKVTPAVSAKKSNGPKYK